MVRKSTHLQVIPAKHPKHIKFAITDMRDKPVNFLLFNTGVDFSLRNQFANSGSFAKVSVPVHIYNSLVKGLYVCGSCGTPLSTSHHMALLCGIDNGGPQLPQT